MIYLRQPPPKFFEYLRGEIGLPSDPGQEAGGLFECFTCFQSVKEAIVREDYVYWTCPNGHKNKEPYRDELE